jgi:hypothetical protein
VTSTEVRVTLEAVIVAVTDNEPRILCVNHSGAVALPSGPLEPERDRTLELAFRRWVREQTGIEVGYAEQLYTFGDRDRLPVDATSVPTLSVAYLALVREERPSQGAAWRNWYELFPWEDQRSGSPPLVAEVIKPVLTSWVAEAGENLEALVREERSHVGFGLGGLEWDGVRALERYELLYELGLVAESGRSDVAAIESQSMALDHRRIAATALTRLRGKLTYRPVVFEMIPEEFTLLRLQHVVEALAGVRLHKQNFRRVVDRAGLVEGTGEMERGTGGRPAELFRFRREVLLERPRAGVGLPLE